MSSKLDFSKELIGRRALVTGGTRGIGAAIAQRLLDAGAKVVVTARSRGESSPAGATFVAGDVASVAGAQAIAAAALGALGGLDILVNNAGGASGFPQGTASIPEEAWQASFALNLFAAIRLTNALLPALRESKAGNIVNISSGAIDTPAPTLACYGMTKAAVAMLTKTLAWEVGPLGIRVNALAPGVIETNFSRHNFVDEDGNVDPERLEKYRKRFSAMAPLKRVGSAQDVADSILFLVSDRASFMTGQILRPNGGTAMPW